jgi:hypothetical protein
MARKQEQERMKLAVDIQRQLGTEATTRFMHAQPQFGVEPDIPDRFLRLLRRLDSAQGTKSQERN